MQKLEIDRRWWYRGQGAERSRLLRPEDGEMCCLGHFGLACGVPPPEMYDISMPVKTHAVWPEWVMRNMIEDPDSDLAKVVTTNDDDDIGDAEREARLTEIFAGHDAQV